MAKYRIVCKGCNKIHGHSDNPVVDMAAKCPDCGLDRIAVEPVPEEILTDLEFDVFISNKRNGVTRSQGCIIPVADYEGKSEKEFKEIFINKIAKTLAEVLKVENVNALLSKK